VNADAVVALGAVEVAAKILTEERNIGGILFNKGIKEKKERKKGERRRWLCFFLFKMQEGRGGRRR